jgi:tetratricopeptide (TPR) repeat protein
MACVYYTQGHPAKALELHEESLSIYLKALGAEHPDVAKAYGNMASVYYDQGDAVKALELQEDALIIRLKVLGAEHSLTKSYPEIYPSTQRGDRSITPKHTNSGYR